MAHSSPRKGSVTQVRPLTPRHVRVTQQDGHSGGAPLSLRLHDVRIAERNELELFISWGGGSDRDLRFGMTRCIGAVCHLKEHFFWSSINYFARMQI